MSEETVEARQDNEFEALTAIFGDDLKDLRKKTAWNRWQPLNLSVTLTPQQGSSGTHEVYVKTDLHIICSAKYPNEVPKLLLENTRGLSHAVSIQLLDELQEKAVTLKGEEMIFQLAQYVQEFLHRHNKPGFKSFYEEMLNRQRQEEQMLEQAEKLAKDKEKKVMLEEIQRRQEILKSESRLRREQRYNSENSTENEEANGRGHVNSESSEDSVCSHFSTKVIEFSNNGCREIQRGGCIHHSHNGHSVFSGIDRSTGELVIVSEWTAASKNNTDHIYAQRQVSSIEQELNYLVKLKHQNLGHYLNIKHEQLPDENNKIVVHVLREFVLGSNCASLFVSKNVAVDFDLLRHLVHGVLSAVDYLHRNNVVHKEIKHSCIYINNKGLVKVTNYSINRRLSDLVCQQIFNSYSKKTDIFKIGTLILSLLKGSIISDENSQIPTTIPTDLYDFLEKCLHKEEKNRYTASQLLNHTFLKTPIENFVPKTNDIEDSVPEVMNLPKNDSHDSNVPNLSGQSRVKNEFEFLQHLGKGAYGDVIKVRNNLDGRYYAIKRIELNPKNKQLKKKIVREVKLLSRLNHENVVRYYNSWIETALIEIDDNDTSASISLETVPKVIIQKELTFKDDIEALAPPIKNVVEWPVNADTTRSFSALHSSSSESDSSDEENLWMINPNESDSDDVQFERDGSNTESSTETSATNVSTKGSDTVDSVSRNVKEVQFMYIQMEFCEKSTLRTAIDNNLHLEEDRVWRLFREIVEGLAHIHQQGMIHRDLKPVNIFLDSNDHVKIGDFGLATTSMKSKQSEYYTSSKSLLESEKEDVNDSMTGQVGTALYVAPELCCTQKATYNQKVDIYSLGIILFEMCFKPLSTGMERIKILSGLRTKEILFPLDFRKPENEKKEYLIRWLLNHDATLRPTSQELLMSEYVPPPVLEERELREFVRHTLSNPQLKAYKYLVASCFKQSLTPAQDITYDKDPTAPTLAKPLQLYEAVRQSTLKIFKLHGGQNLPTPLQMPKCKYYENMDTCVNLMTHSGNIVSIPHDLRVPFARYVAWNGITLLRRYSIERVYREKKVFGFLPRELYECAFDIVTPTKGNFMSDAEILYIVCEIIDDLPGLKNKNFTIRLNHTLLIKAILLHYCIKDNHDEVYRLLTDAREGKIPKSQLQTSFISYGLSDNMITTLMNLLNSEFDYPKAVSVLQFITKRRSGEACQLAKQALQELKTIIHNADALGVPFDIIISPGLVYNMRQYSGMICQVVCELKKKHKKGFMDVLAAGGRYDTMIAEYRNIMDRANMSSKDVHQSAVGISISLDKLVQALQEEQGLETNKIAFLDVVVCSLGSKPLLKEKAKILKCLWSSGIRSCAIEANNIEDIQEQCNDLKVCHAIMLKENEQGSIKVRSWERERFQEKTFKMSELAENMQRLIKNWSESGHSDSCNNSALTRSDRSLSIDVSHDVNALVQFVTSERLSSNTRKRFDNQIRSQLDNTLKRLNGEVIIFGLNIESIVIKTVAFSLVTDSSEQEFFKSVESITEKHPRNRKYLTEVCDEIREYKMRRTNPIVILYSLLDSYYAVLV